jgi:hypothetical protein
MDIDDALDQHAVIHTHLARAETYRGYRPFALVASGAVGMAAAVLQARRQGGHLRGVAGWAAG